MTINSSNNEDCEAPWSYDLKLRLSFTKGGIDTGIYPETLFSIECDPWRDIEPVVMKNYYSLISSDTHTVKANDLNEKFTADPIKGNEEWSFTIIDLNSDAEWAPAMTVSDKITD